MGLANIRLRPSPPPLIAIVALVFVTCVKHARADDDATHVRALSVRLEPLIREGSRRSPAFRSLIERLNVSNVFVYIESATLPSSMLGRAVRHGVRSFAWRTSRGGRVPLKSNTTAYCACPKSASKPVVSHGM